MNTIAAITPGELHERMRSGARIELIDVRTTVEFREVHAVGARSVPLDRLDPKALAAGRPADAGPLYLICKGGTRGRQACERLAAAGVADAVNVEGGTDAWAAAGLPVARGRKCISLERQVRIAAGSLVLAGLGLGWSVHPGFLGLSAFVGAGLVFAGITDTCGMGLLLARMPWNRVGEEPEELSAAPAPEPAGTGTGCAAK
jgi:rhodanese-related sulfurtransferase